MLDAEELYYKLRDFAQNLTDDVNDQADEHLAAAAEIMANTANAAE